MGLCRPEEWYFEGLMLAIKNIDEHKGVHKIFRTLFVDLFAIQRVCMSVEGDFVRRDYARLLPFFDAWAEIDFNNAHNDAICGSSRNSSGSCLDENIQKAVTKAKDVLCGHTDPAVSGQAYAGAFEVLRS